MSVSFWNDPHSHPEHNVRLHTVTVGHPASLSCTSSVRFPKRPLLPPCLHSGHHHRQPPTLLRPCVCHLLKGCKESQDVTSTWLVSSSRVNEKVHDGTRTSEFTVRFQRLLDRRLMNASRQAIVMVSPAQVSLFGAEPKPLRISSSRLSTEWHRYLPSSWVGSGMAYLMRNYKLRSSHASQWWAVILWQRKSRRDSKRMQHPHDKSINKPFKTRSKLGLAPQALLGPRGWLFAPHPSVTWDASKWEWAWSPVKNFIFNIRWSLYW